MSELTLTGNRSDYSVVLAADGSLTVSDLRAGSPDGSHTIGSGAHLQFADAAVFMPGALSIHGVPGTSVYLGYSVAVADINGDGFADVVLVAGGEGGGETRNDQPGGSYVFFGSAAGLPPNPYIANVNPAEGFTIDNVGFSRGLHVGAAGDVNGDGIPDLLVGDGHAYHNAAYVVFGKSGGFGDHFDPSTLDGSDGFKVLGGYNSGVGGAVAPAGDVNGDGYDDIIVGAPSSAGAAYVVFGKAGGFPAVLPVQSLDGSNGFRIIGNPHIHGFGTSVAAGDINGDGFSDLIVGYSVGGKADVVFGKAGGFAATVNVTALDGSNGFAINHAGANVSAADVNGDGFADVITGSGGTATVLFGHAGSFTSAIDIIANSSDTLFLYNAPNDGSPGDGDDGGEPVTDLTVTSAGDVNGDGFDDLLVGDLQATPSGPYVDSYGYSHDHFAGEAFVIYGKASGLSGMRIDLSQPLPASVGFSITGTAAQNLGAVAAAGDINGDGFSDLVIGAPGQDFTNSHSGDVFVIYGQAPDQAVHLVGTDIGQTLAGGRFDDTLSGLGGNDVLHGNGGNDSIDGGDGTDTAVYSGQQSDYSVVNEPDGTTIVTDLRVGSPDGTDTLTSVENLLFLGRPLTIKPQVHFAVNNDIFVVSSSIGTAEDFLGDGAGHFGDGAPGGVGIATGTTLHAAVGDLNGDGIPDVITAARNIDQLHVNIGIGNGAFNQGGTVNFIPHQGLWAEIGDINGDGDADAVAITSHAASPISLILGNGDGTFKDPVETGSGLSSPTMLKLADFDGDGALDAAIVDSGAIKIATLSGGTAVTITHTYTPGNGTNLIAVGDVNGDGKMDIVAGNSGDGTVSVLLGQGDLTFTDGGTFNAGNSPVSLILADVNGDGALDIVAGRQDFGSGQGVSVLLNDGSGNFTAHTNVISGGVAEGTAIAVGDFNNDGHADLAVADGIQGIMFTFLGNGSGTSFATGISKFIPSGVSDLEVANFDTNTPLLSIEEDIALVLSTANHNAITISDDGVGTDTVHLTVVHGRLTLGSDANLTVSGDGTGSILVSGLAADLNAALDGLTYQPGADYNGTDTLYINVTDDGTGVGSGDSRVIAIASVNDAPILHNLRSGDFVLGQGPQGIVSDVNLADDSGRLQGATVQIENVQSGDVLAVHERHNITASYDAASGTLTLSGDDTVSNYLGVLFSLTFDTTSAVRDARTVDFSISDGSLSSTASGIVNITDINTAPSGIDKTISFGEDAMYTFSTSDFAFTDANGNGLLAVVIASLPSAGTLTDDGSAVYVGQYVWADDLASGKLQFTPDADANGYASFTFQVHDDGGSNFGGVDYDTTPNTITFNVTPVNDAPVLAGTGAAPATFSFGEGDAPLAVASGLTISDDSVNLVGATVQISTGFTAGDALGFTDTAYIHGSYDAATGLLTLTGTDTVANYQAALQSITFGTNSDNPTAHGTHSTRAFSWSVTDDGGEISNTAVGSFRVTGVNDAPVLGGSSTDAPRTSIKLLVTDAANNAQFDPSHPPVFSPDGSKVAFFSRTSPLSSDFNYHVYMKDLHTGALATVSVPNAGTNDYSKNPSFSPDGSKLVFLATVNSASGYYVQDLATGTATLIAKSSSDDPAAFSPDSSKLYFYGSDASNNQGLYVKDFGTGDLTRLVPGTVSGVNAALSGDKLAYVQSHDLKVLDLSSGTSTTVETHSPDFRFAPESPVFSPDGTKIAFINQFSYELDILDLATGQILTVAQYPWLPIAGEAAFTSDGTKLVFPAYPQGSGSFNVYMVDLATGAYTLTAGGSGVTGLSGISHDGSQIAFISSGDLVAGVPSGRYNLYLASLGYTENQTGVVITGGLTLRDPDSSTLHSATVSISDGFTAGDVLGFADTTNIHGSYDPIRGVLTLTGDDTPYNYMLSLRSVTFSSTSDNPTANDTQESRTLTWQVSDDQGDASNSPTTTFQITAVNDAAMIGTITGIASQTIYEDAPTVINGIPSDFITDDSDPTTAEMVVTLAVDHGTLTVNAPGLALDYNGTAPVTVTGTQDQLNVVLHGGGLQYQSDLNYNGSDTLHVTVDDEGNGGIGGALQSTQDFGFTVTAINDAPAGTDGTVTALEDTAYAFASADFGFSDPLDGTDHLLAVKITTLPGAGTLMHDGLAVSAGDVVSVADIAAGKLTFKAAQDANGTGYTSFNFQVQDDGGTLNSGADIDASPNTITVDVTPVNDQPTGVHAFVTTLEDTTYVFSASDFAFNDPNDSPSNALLAVKVSGLIGQGALLDNGVAVTDGQFVSIADINAGKFVFTPAANDSGGSGFFFSVQDDGGTANGGVDLAVAKNMTINITAVNDAPAGTDKTVTVLEDTGYVFHASDFGFTDPADGTPNSLLAVEITTLPSHGVLTDNGVAVTAGQFIPVADIAGGLLHFAPAADVNGAGYASFTFQVQDNGGALNGGVDLDASPNTITVNVTSVNDAPSGADNTVTMLEDTNYLFATIDFGFSDPNDVSANALLAVEITALPAHGQLWDNDVRVSAGQFVSVADIAAGKLLFRPDAFANGNGYTSFTFQVQDNGGTANGGVNVDPTPKTITVNVTPVNDQPGIVIVSSAAYTEGGQPVTLASTVVIGDPDNTTLPGATVRIVDALAGDVLTIGGQTSGTTAGITFQYTYDSVSGTGALVLSGSASQADYIATLRSIAFASSSDNPTGNGDHPNRALEWSVTDGALTSNVFGTTVDITAVNSAPVLSGGGGGVNYNLSTPAAVSTGLSFTDVDSNKLGGAAATISAGYLSGDALAVNLATSGGFFIVDDGHGPVITNIAVQSNCGGALTLTGVDTFQHYQMVLDAIRYSSTADDPTAGGTDRARAITWTVTDDSGDASNTVTTTVSIPNAPPQVTADTGAVAAGGTLSKTAQAGVLANDTDPDNDALQVLSVGGQAPGQSIAGQYGHLTLSADGHYTYVADNASAIAAAATGQHPVDNFSYLVSDGHGGTTPATLGISIDRPVTFSPANLQTNELTPLNTDGSFLEYAFDPDGDVRSLAPIINGAAITFGQPITLPSGAVLTVNAFGGFTYDPNHAFDSLAGPRSGASNNQADDGFTYTLTNGLTGRVNIHVYGVDSFDTLIGTNGPDVLTGGDSDDTIDGGAGNDTAVYGGARVDYAVTYNPTTHAYTIADRRPFGTDGTDIVKNVESFKFADGIYTFDTGGSATIWSSIVTTTVGNVYDAVTSQAVNLDNGGKWVNTYNALGASSSPVLWSSAHYDAGGHLLTQVTTNINGTHTLTVNDAANAYAWTNFTLSYSANWTQTGLTGLMDSGSTAIAMKDISAAFDVTLWYTTPFDPDAGKAVDQTIGSGAVGGTFYSGGNNVLFGFAGNDHLLGGASDDVMNGGMGADTLDGGFSGSDVFVYNSVAESTGTGYDTVLNFTQQDRFDLPVTVLGGNASVQHVSGSLSLASFDGDLATGLGTALQAKRAEIYDVTGGDLSGHYFLVVDANGVAGYQSGEDFVFDISSFGGSVPFVRASNFI